MHPNEAINDLIVTLGRKCPHFQPPIFPFCYSPNTIDSLFEPEEYLKAGDRDIKNEMSMKIKYPLFETKVNTAERCIDIISIKVRLTIKYIYPFLYTFLLSAIFYLI